MSRRTAMVGALLAMYFFSYFQRTSPAVIAPYLIQDFSLNAAELGLLSSIYFYTYAVIQAPLGPLLDFIGPRIVITILGAIAAIGSLIFALAPSFTQCLIGRGLVGLGMGSVLMGTITIIAVWYPPRFFATLSGWVFAVGNIGGLMATLPLALLSRSLGWRNSFLLLAIISFFIVAAIWITVRDYPPDQAQQRGKAKGSFEAKQAYRLLLGSISFWKIAILNFFLLGSFFAILSLWGGPFLNDVFGMTPAGAGTILVSMTLGMIIGNPFIGFLYDRLAPHARKRMDLICFALYILPLFLFCAFLRPGRDFLLFPAYFSLGLLASSGLLLIARLKAVYPPQILGTALTLNNFFGFGGVAVLQYLMGLIIGRYPHVGNAYPLEAYRSAFYLLLAGLVIAFLFYACLKDSPSSPTSRQK
jgi:predicted MFS family arabinose efflux permease